MWGDFSANLEGNVGMEDSEGCKREIPLLTFFRPIAAYLQNLSEIEKKGYPCRFGPFSDMHS